MGNPIHERLYIRKNATNLILKEDEIIRYRMNEYFGGSINQYALNITRASTGAVPVRRERELLHQIFQMNQPYKSSKQRDFNELPQMPPLLEMHVVITEHEDDSADRTLVLFVNEQYVLYILDFTDHRVKSFDIVATEDLMHVFNTFIGEKEGSNQGLTPSDIYCNSLTVVEQGRVYTVP